MLEENKPQELYNTFICIPKGSEVETKLTINFRCSGIKAGKGFTGTTLITLEPTGRK